jgi:predicted Zn finger-like uncharacterized protein
MIVTCPGCGAKYRVRDESVPQGGAELKCPTCSSVFVAHPPKHSEAEISTALERVTRAKEAAEAKLAEIDAVRAGLEQRALEAERAAQEAEARLQQAEASIIVLRSELGAVQSTAQGEVASRLQPLEAEVMRWREEAARAIARANAAADAEVRVLQMTEELARARAAANHAPEVARLTEELSAAQRGAGRLRTELDSAQQNVSALQAELHRTQERLRENESGGARPSLLEDEVQRLRGQLANASTTPPGPALSPAMTSLIAAVAPMLWGLEQAIKYLEPFAATEPALAGHVRQLQLLHGVLTRLSNEAKG